MREENEFYDTFAKVAQESGLITDIQNLDQYEQGVGNAQLVLNYFGLIPVVGDYIDKVSRIALQHDQRRVDELRQRISVKSLRCINEIKLKNFSSEEQSKNFDQFLYRINPFMMNEAAREELTNMRAQARIHWLSASFTDAKVDRARILAEIQQENLIQTQYLQQLTASAQQFDTKLRQLQSQQTQEQVVLNKEMKQLQAGLARNEIFLEEKIVLLLQKDMKTAEQLENITAYLAVQEAHKQAERSHQELEALYTGAIRGFELLSSLGRFAQNPFLVKVAVVGNSSVQIHRAVQQIPHFVGLAVMNPMAVVGMALLNITGLFFKPGPDPHKIIMKQLERISEQINKLQVFIHDKFRDMSNQLYRLEAMVIHNFQKIHYLISIPITRRLEDIHQDLQTLAGVVKIGFQDILLSKFQEHITEVESIDKGIIAVDAFSRSEIIDKLVSFYHWIKISSYNKHFTAMLLIQDDEMHWRTAPKQSVAAFLSIKDSREVMPILLVFANQQKWLSYPKGRFPHTGIWLQAVSSYLTLRFKFKEKLKGFYDKEDKEINEINTLCHQHLNEVESLVYNQLPLKNINQRLIELFTELQDQYQSLQLVEKKRHQQSSPLGQANLNLFSSFDEKIISTLVSDKIPKKFSFEYVQGEDKGHRIGRQREFTAANGFTQEDCLRLIHHRAESQGIPLFHKLLLFAEKAELVEFRCRMHRSMSNRGQQRFETEGKLYGLEIILYIRESQEKLRLTHARPGYARWDSADRKTTQTTINSHKRELPNYTEFKNETIGEAILKVKVLIEKRFENEKQIFYQKLSAMWLNKEGLIYKIMLYLCLAQHYLANSQSKIMDWNYEYILKPMQKLVNALENPSVADHSVIEKYLNEFRSVTQQLSKSTLLIQPADKVFISCVQDLYLGLRLFRKYKDPEEKNSTLNNRWSTIIRSSL